MSRFARALAALRTADPAPEPRADAIADVLAVLGQELAAINARLDTIAAAAPAPAPVAPARPTVDLTPVYNAIDTIAPDPGPFRAHLTQIAERLLRDQDNTPDIVADIILRGEED